MFKPIKPPTVPEWFRAMPDDAMIDADQAAELFGLASAQCVYNSASVRSFPRPDGERPCSRGNRTKKLWRKDTLVAELSRRGRK